MKILFLTRWYPPYGGIFVERHAQAVALNHKLTVLAVLPGESSSGTNPVIDHPAVHREYTVIRYFYRPSLCRITCVAGLVNLLRFFSRSVAGYRYLAKQGISFDLVHVHILTRAAVLAYFLNLVKGTPYIITEHWTRYIPENRGFTGIIRKTITRMILRRAAAATTVSSYLKSAMQDCGLDHKKFLIIPNVVDTGLFTIPGNDGNRNLKRIIHVSNFHERAKNIFGILRVISILRKKRQDFEVLFVGGKEPFLENAKEYASGLGLESPVVVFKGRLTAGEIAAAYGESSFLLMFSNFESFSVVIPEALACGIPVVATSAGGIPEYFDNEAGRLVSPGDEPGLLDSLSFMLDHCHTFDPNGLRSLVESRFGHDSVGRQFDDLYSSV